MKPKLLLIGGGGHCRSLIDVIEAENRFEIFGILDDNSDLIGKKVFNYTIFGTTEKLAELRKECPYAIIAIGQINCNVLRKKFYKKLIELKYQLPSIISPYAYVSKYASIGEGTAIMHHALINANAKIGNNCIINTKALIEHDVIVEDHCHISTGAIINGNVIVRKNTFFGSNSISKEGIIIEGFIKAGSLIK